MTNLPIKCESCGRTLSNATEVCKVCEAMLTTPSDIEIYGINQDDPKFICPCCNIGFQKINRATWPQAAPWYKYQGIRDVCPNCDALLRPRYKTRKYIYIENFTSILVMFTVLFGFVNKWHFIGAIVLIGAQISYCIIMELRKNKDIHWYIQDQPNN